jgi:hypothetical protein
MQTLSEYDDEVFDPSDEGESERIQSRNRNQYEEDGQLDAYEAGIIEDVRNAGLL